MINVLENTSNQPSKFGTKNQVEINFYVIFTYNKKNLMFKSAMVNASLCD